MGKGVTGVNTSSQFTCYFSALPSFTLQLRPGSGPSRRAHGFLRRGAKDGSGMSWRRTFQDLNLAFIFIYTCENTKEMNSQLSVKLTQLLKNKIQAGKDLGISTLFTWISLIAQLVKNPPAMQETPVQFLDWEDLLEKG